MKKGMKLLPLIALSLSLMTACGSTQKPTSYYLNDSGNLIAVLDNGTESDLGKWDDDIIKSLGNITVSGDGFYVINGIKTDIKAKVTSSYDINGNGHLIVTYTDGSTEDLGSVEESIGNGVKSVSISDDGYYVINGIKTTIQAVNTYTVSFSTGFSTVIESQKVKDGYKVERPEIERTGYTLVGWFCNGEEWRFNSDVVKSDMTLSAEWTANSYTITFLNEKGDAPEPLNVIYDSTFTLPDINPTAGYTFNGWFNGTSKVSDGIWNIASDVTLSAQWSRNQYKIVFDENGGSTVQDITADSYSTISELPTPSWADHTFLGWFDSNGNKVESVSVTENDVHLIAHWKGVSDSFEFRDETDGTVTITKFIGNENELIVPATIGGKKVKTIAENAFIDGYAIKKLTFNSVTTQFEYKSMYGLTSLEEMTICGDVSGSFYYFFGNSATNVPTTFKTVTFAEGSTTYGKAIFADLPESYLFSVNLPKSVKKTPYDCFYGCKNIEKCYVPSGVTGMDDRTFCACTNLKVVNIPYTCTSLGANCFVNCDKLPYLIVPSSVTSFGYASLAATESVIFLERTTELAYSSIFSIYKDSMHIYYGFEEIQDNETFEYALCKVGSVKKSVILGLVDGASRPSELPEMIDGYLVDYSLI